MTWEKNTLYTSEASDHVDNAGNILPDWLKDREEMIFHSSCINRSQELGSGQYGSVHKGLLVQGKAVEVRE